MHRKAFRTVSLDAQSFRGNDNIITELGGDCLTYLLC